MICRRTVVSAVLFGILSTATAMSQTDGRYRDTKARVLDLLFPLDVSPDSYLTKMALRFGDSDTQLVVLIYPVYPVHPGGRAEIICYSIAGMGDGELSQLISKMVAQSPNMTDREIAAKLKVDVSRSPIGYEALNRFLNELKAIRISPVLASRTAVDEYSEYEFWYDTGQECVHYTVTTPFGNAPQDKLGEWMIKFRASVPDLLKAGSAPKR